MAKKAKLETPAWIKEGYDSPEDYAKAQGKSVKKKASGKTYKVKICPKCKSENVGVVLVGEEGKGAKDWECRKCGWSGRNISEKELSEDDFLDYLDRKEAEEKDNE